MLRSTCAPERIYSWVIDLGNRINTRESIEQTSPCARARLLALHPASTPYPYADDSDSVALLIVNTTWRVRRTTAVVRANSTAEEIEFPLWYRTGDELRLLRPCSAQPAVVLRHGH